MNTAGVHAGSAPRSTPRRLTAGLWTAALVTALAHTWPYRFRLVNLDAVSYLDLADAWRAGQWREAINGYWSPAYSWLLAAAIGIFEPQPQNEYVLLHGVNFILALVAFAAFWMLLRELLRELPPEPTASFSPAMFAAIASTLMFWFAITQIVVWMESPDLIPSAATFAASALLLRLRRRPTVRDAALLGATLGVGYLGKAAMFPLALVFVLTAAAVARHARPVVVTAAVLSFAVVAGPWIVALSMTKQRVTFGDAGAINYLYFVNRSEDWPHHWPVHWPHWDGIEGRGEPAHAARRLHDDPAVYEFATPFPATYPMWYDPSYWNEGVSPQFDLKDQLRRLKLSASDYFGIFTINFYNRDFFNPQPALAALLFVLWLGAAAPRRGWTPAWPLIVPSVAALAMYAAVYVEPRYVGAPILVIWVAVLAGVRLPGSPDARCLARVVGRAMIAVVAIALAGAISTESSTGWRRLLRGEPDEVNLPWQIVTALRERGIGPHTPVAIVGNAQVASRWARLGRVRIVAETPASDLWRFATGEPATVNAVVDAFRRTPAQLILAEQVPLRADAAGWTRIEGTPYWMLPLQATGSIEREDLDVQPVFRDRQQPHARLDVEPAGPGSAGVDDQAVVRAVYERPVRMPEDENRRGVARQQLVSCRPAELVPVAHVDRDAPHLQIQPPLERRIERIVDVAAHRANRCDPLE